MHLVFVWSTKMQEGSLKCFWGGFVLNAEDDINWGTEAVFVAGGLVVIDWGQNTHITPTKRDCEKDGLGSRDSNVRVGREEHVIVLCIDCSCFHVLTHPRDHWEKKRKTKKADNEWQIQNSESFLVSNIKIFHAWCEIHFKTHPSEQNRHTMSHLISRKHSRRTSSVFHLPLIWDKWGKCHRRLPFKPKKKKETIFFVA